MILIRIADDFVQLVNHRPLFVYRHRLGTPAEDDVLVYEEKDSGFYVGVNETQSGRFATIYAHDHQTSEVYLIDAEAPETPPRLIAAREHGHEYAVDHHGDRLFVMTNSGGAEDFRICEAPLADPQMGNWREVLPQQMSR